MAVEVVVGAAVEVVVSAVVVVVRAVVVGLVVVSASPVIVELDIDQTTQLANEGALRTELLSSRYPLGSA